MAQFCLFKVAVLISVVDQKCASMSGKSSKRTYWSDILAVRPFIPTVCVAQGDKTNFCPVVGEQASPWQRVSHNRNQCELLLQATSPRRTCRGV